jgi:transcription termination factor Rho
MELHLNRDLSDKRIFPAIDVTLSGTRQEEILLDEPTLKKVVTLRRMLALLGNDPAVQTEALVEKLGKTSSNKEFLESLNKG